MPRSRIASNRARNTIVGLLAVLSLLLGAAACASSGNKANRAADSSSAKTTTLRIGLLGPTGTGDNISLFVAQDKGFFAQDHLKIVRVSTDGSTGTAALASGSLDTLDSSTVISAQKKDPDIKVVANTMNNPFYLVVKPDSGISRLSDLKHKTIASTSAGGGFDQWIKTALTLNTDLNLNTDVKFLYVGAAQAVISAVQGGTADAGTANFTTLAQAKKEKLTTVHVPSSPKNPAPSVWGISEKHAASKRKAIETFFADMAKGARYAKNPNNKADTIKIIAKYYKIGHQEAVAMYKNQVPALTSDLSVNANDIKPALKYGVIKSLRNDNPKNYIDTSWVK